MVNSMRYLINSSCGISEQRSEGRDELLVKR